MSRYRTHTCGQLRSDAVGAEVKLAGWVHRKRDHGNLLFIDLRDHYGITQIVGQPGSSAFATLEAVRLETVISVRGTVTAREREQVNPSLATGAIEIVAAEVEVLGPAEVLPFPVVASQDPPEEVRLRHRYL